ncbi:MAG: site-2 protease family protein [Rhodospirillaceae bacterium]
MDNELLTKVAEVVVFAIPAILAITLHEAAHGYAALWRGDPTAKEAGRLSLNPIRHIDLMGTVLLPGFLIASGAPFLFGWAKPVPVNFARLKNPRRDMVTVAIAGPGTNLFLAIVSALLIHLALLAPDPSRQWFISMLIESMKFNVILGLFNMIPLPPMDGGRVAVGLLPLPAARALARLENYGMFLILGAVVILPWLGSYIGADLNILAWTLLPLTDAVVNGIAVVAGLTG